MIIICEGDRPKTGYYSITNVHTDIELSGCGRAAGGDEGAALCGGWGLRAHLPPVKVCVQRGTFPSVPLVEELGWGSVEHTVHNYNVTFKLATYTFESVYTCPIKTNLLCWAKQQPPPLVNVHTRHHSHTLYKIKQNV